MPVAAPCYAGPEENDVECQNIKAQWTDTAFQSQFPIGYSYPQPQFCDIPGGNTTTCSIGDSPIYAVDANHPEIIAAAILFAKDKNIRVAVKMTGHDLLGRSTGYGSLEIWLRNLQGGVIFEESYKQSRSCSGTQWTGSAISIGGGYRWSDVYPVAEANNVVVIGGSCPVRKFPLSRDSAMN